MNEKSWKIEVVLDRGRVHLRLTEGPGHSKSDFPIWKRWLIDRLSWWALGLGIATYIQTL